MALPTPDRRASPAPGLEGQVTDVHVHVFSPQVIRAREAYLQKDGWFRLLYEDPKARMVPYENVIEQMDSTGVARSVIFGFAYKDQGLCRETNDYVLEGVKAYPDRFVGLACVSPEEPGATQELERCLNAGLRGAGELFPDGQGLDLRHSPSLDRVADTLAERRLPLLLHSNEPVGHVYPGKGDNTPGPCFDFARRHQDLTLIYAHMGGGLFFYELMPKVREALSHVYYDTSAVPYLYRREVYALAAAAAGPDKLLFGSDYPLLSPARYLEETEELDPALRQAVFAQNAAVVFGHVGRSPARES